MTQPSLIDAMRAQIHTTPMDVAGTRSAQRWHWHARLMSGVALLLAAAAVIVLELSTSSSVPPAYAATFHMSGAQRTVTITLRDEQDIPKLNTRLAALHTRIRVVPVTVGCDAPVHVVSNGAVIPGPARTLLASPLMKGDGGRVISMTIAVDTVPGRTFVIPYSRTGLHSGGESVVVGPAPSCVGIAP